LAVGSESGWRSLGSPTEPCGSPDRYKSAGNVSARGLIGEDRPCDPTLERVIYRLMQPGGQPAAFL